MGWAKMESIIDFFSDEKCSVRRHSISIKGRYSFDLDHSVASSLQRIKAPVELMLPANSYHVFVEVILVFRLSYVVVFVVMLWLLLLCFGLCCFLLVLLL